MAFTTHTLASSWSPVAALRNAIQPVQDVLAKRTAYIAAYRELNTLSDRELADIGVARSMIREIAKQSVTK